MHIFGPTWRKKCILGQILVSKKDVNKNSIPTLPSFFQTIALNTDFDFGLTTVVLVRITDRIFKSKL